LPIQKPVKKTVGFLAGMTIKPGIEKPKQKKLFYPADKTLCHTIF
jgi:hypothetical protein